MSFAVDEDHIFAEVSGMLRATASAPASGRDITMDTTLTRDLGLQGLDMAGLSGRVYSRYGAAASLGPLFAKAARAPSRDLRVGDLVGYIAFAVGQGAARIVAQPVLGSYATAGSALLPCPCSIVISSGRCGSTLLSRLIAMEPETASVSESLGHVRTQLLFSPAAAVTGPQYWTLLSEPSTGGALLDRLGFTPDELRYPSSGRYATHISTLPRILRITLPALSVDPDRLFDQLAKKVPQFPPQQVGQHHKMFLDLLAGLTGRRRWVERSGGSSQIARPVLAAFPTAKIVYLSRNIADTALSMSRHPSFQISAAVEKFCLGAGVARREIPRAGELPEKVKRLIAGLTEEKLREMGRDIGFFKMACAHIHGAVEQAFADLRPRHLHRIKYEDLLANPADELARLGEFLGFTDPYGWADTAMSHIMTRQKEGRPSLVMT